MTANIPFGSMLIHGYQHVLDKKTSLTEKKEVATSPIMKINSMAGRDTIEFTAKPLVSDDPTGIKNMPNPFNM